MINRDTWVTQCMGPWDMWDEGDRQHKDIGYREWMG